MAKYRQRMKIGEPPHSWNGLSDEDRLVAVGADDTDDGGEPRFSISGALMLSTERIISRELSGYFLEHTTHSTLGCMMDERITSIDGDSGADDCEHRIVHRHPVPASQGVQRAGRYRKIRREKIEEMDRQKPGMTD